MNAPELSRVIKLRQIRQEPVIIDASEAERSALSQRFGIVGIDHLHAEIMLEPKGQDVSATGDLVATIRQDCAISGEEFQTTVRETIALVFVPASPPPQGEEIEVDLDTQEPDEIEYDGDSFDLGEAIAQTLALSIDPYAEGPGADAARQKAGIMGDDTPSGPLAEALAALKKG